MPRLEIKAQSNKKRLDQALSELLPERTRSNWSKQIKLGLVKLNGKTTRPSAQVKTGDSLTYSLPATPLQELDVPIIFEDDNVLVLNKPSGMLTHSKGSISEEFTLADFIRPKLTDIVVSNRAGIVHRLDRDTSGVMVTAKTAKAYDFLQRQFAKRSVDKEYRAIVEGELGEEQAIIEFPIERNPKKPSLFRVNERGKPAKTLVKQVAQLDNGDTYVSLRPETGRTHQLRVHMSYLEHPIVGDRFYGHAGEHLLLHAWKIRFDDLNGQRRTFLAPLPNYFLDYLDSHGYRRHE